MLDGLSLDQVRTFIAAVDEGSFSAAGRRLGRAQSVVSQTLGQLEGQLGVKLFDRGARYPVLTEAGVPCGPINDVRGGVELATSLGLDPVVTPGGVPSVRNPVRMSATPPRYDLPPPALDAHGDEIRAWLGLPARTEGPVA